MYLFRRISIALTLSLVTVFCLEQMVYIALGESESKYLLEFIDLESSNDKSEDQKEGKEIKVFKPQFSNSNYLARLHKSTPAGYGQYRVLHSLEVFLDVVTPPPEA